MGNYVGSWQDLFTNVPAQVRPIRGSEQTVHEKLRGTGIIEVTVRYTSESSTVDTDDMLQWNGVDYNVRYIENPDMKRRYLKMTCERGVASG